MFGWLKKIFEFDKAMDSISEKEIFEEDKSLCKAKKDGNVLILKDTECSLISELKQNQKFLDALTKELADLNKGIADYKNVSNLIRICRNVNHYRIVPDDTYVSTYEVEYLNGMLSNVNIPMLVKELESIESKNKIIQEYHNNISETKKRIKELKGKLGIDGI